VAGIFNRSGCQSSPSFEGDEDREFATGEQQPLRTGSSRTTLIGPSGRPRTVSCQVAPLSWVRKMCGFRSSMRRLLMAA
jgi:hypothetical protein